MIIIDLSQILHAAVHSDMKTNGTKMPSERGIRIYVLNKIQYVRSKFIREFGKETVIAVDNNSWRKEVFPHYKYKRKEDRKDDNLNWDVIHGYFSNIKAELKEHFPYAIMDVYGAEGDDIVAVMCRSLAKPVIIIGQDKDYFQLHGKGNIKQYCPIKDVLMTSVVSEIPYNLFTHICRGDTSDGICSMINPSNCFVEGIRQKSLYKTYIEEAYDNAKKGRLKEFLGKQTHKRFLENKTLIDFRCIPSDLSTKIIDTYNNYEIPQTNVYKYLQKYDLYQEFVRDINYF